MHKLIEDYLARREEYHVSDYIGFMLRGAELRCPAFLKDEALCDLLRSKITVSEEPFRPIVLALEEYTEEELRILEDKMPSGWHRAKVCDQLDKIVDSK